MISVVGTYPKDAFVVDGYDIPGNLVVHPLNGGFPYKLNSRQMARLREVKPSIPVSAIFRKAGFRLEGSEVVYGGWTDGQLALGWVMPHFELTEAMRVAAEMTARFDPTLNVFRNRRNGVLETWKAVEIKSAEGKRLKVFPLGAGLWRWHKVQAVLAKPL